MGLLIDGVWHDKGYDTEKHDGQFVRSESDFRHWIGRDDRFPAERNRYHLYVSYACPWAHRALIFRQLKHLTNLIPVTVVNPHMFESGWTLLDQEGTSCDPLYQLSHLHQLYTKAQSDFTGRVTVPVLWDSKTQTIVNNESAEIIRMFNQAFNHLTDNQDDYYPPALQHDIDKINDFVYEHINNGVYKCGFATTQSAYEKAYAELVAAFDKVETILSKQSYLVGNQLTEADWRLFTTFIRFDAVYYSHFKCNYRTIHDTPVLHEYVNRLYQHPGIAETVNFDQIKQHYYVSHTTINPTQIVPVGPRFFF